MSLLEAIKSASPERIVEAFAAAIHAAHTNNPSHGHTAALAVLAQVVEAPAELVAAPGQDEGDEQAGDGKKEEE